MLCRMEEAEADPVTLEVADKKKQKLLAKKGIQVKSKEEKRVERRLREKMRKKKHKKNTTTAENLDFNDFQAQH